MANQNFMDELYKGLGDAITDIRQRFVEEAYFGRVVTEQEQESPKWPEPEAKEQAGAEEHAKEQAKEQPQEPER